MEREPIQVQLDEAIARLTQGILNDVLGDCDHGDEAKRLRCQQLGVLLRLQTDQKNDKRQELMAEAMEAQIAVQRRIAPKPTQVGIVEPILPPPGPDGDSAA